MRCKDHTKETPLSFFLRTLALITILVLVGIHLYLMPAQVQKIRYGYVYDIQTDTGINGAGSVVTWASDRAEEAGVYAGDIVLNPEMNIPGDIGTPVTFLIQSEGNLVHEVTFLRISNNNFYNATIFGFSPYFSLYLGIVLLWISLISTGLFGIAAYCLRADAWLAFFTANAFSHLFALTHWHPGMAFFQSFIPSATIFFLVMFPNGRLAPRWSCLLVFAHLPNNILDYLVAAHILEQNRFVYLAGTELPKFLLLFVSIVLGLILMHRFHHLFTNVERRQIKWAIVGVTASSVPYWMWVTFQLPYPRVHTVDPLGFFLTGLSGYLLFLPFHNIHTLSALMVLGVMLYRYFHFFSPIERQQMKWIVVALLTFAGPLLVAYVFTNYFSIHYQYERSYDLTRWVGMLFMLTVVGIAASISLALFRYRLNDVDLFISHAFVFSGLVIITGMVGVASIALHDFAFSQLPDNQNKLFTTVLFAVSVISLFNPFRTKLQEFADGYFEPGTTAL